jgi:signal transduction histidine kinase/DNA-binding NarL/FixJ family response regulator
MNFEVHEDHQSISAAPTGMRVPKVRRTYNKWVANQTFEDFALRFTAYKARRFSSRRIANTAIGAASFLALEVIGAGITLNYGFTNAVAAILVTSAIILLLAVPVAYNAVTYGVDIDLLTRGTGFGYIGSTVTSLVYATFTFIFFAIEAAIVATALELCLGLPLSVGYLVSALVIIPLVTHGITFISRFHALTQPIWILLQIAPFLFIASQASPAVREWSGYRGLAGSQDAAFDLASFGAAASVIFALTAQIGEQVDFLRFLPPKAQIGKRRWWIAVLSAGPGWMVIGALKILAGSFLAFYAVQHGVEIQAASEPTRMYLNVFQQMLGRPELALGVTGVFVVICQTKINVTNTYAGSIAWSNFFSRLTYSHPGRVVWVVFNVSLGLLLMEFGVYKSGVYSALEQTLGLYAIVAVTWIATIVADLLINKPLGLSPPFIEFKRAHLHDLNPVGVGAMSMSALAALVAYLGAFGPLVGSLYIFVGLIVPFILTPLFAVATKGRYYIARTSQFPETVGATMSCCICEHPFDHEDMAMCPVYSGPICSLCCSLDARCHDRCKEDAHFGDRLRRSARGILPEWLWNLAAGGIGRYLGLLSIVTVLLGAVFWLIYFQSTLDQQLPSAAVAELLTKLFVIIFVIAGIIAWLFVLAQESRAFAEEESQRHTQLLMDEIEAHDETDRQLQKAKEAAESANVNKSKYVVSLSHELRTPLNAILGYAQLLERQQKGLPDFVKNAARTIKRSGQHLADLIEGLLDISKIEAGRLEIFRHKIALRPFLDQIVDMLTIQAEAKGIEFDFQAPLNLPVFVHTDEKHLRQILINLLSNAIKFTDQGGVRFSVSYRGQVATFRIEDTGVGIPSKDIDRVFLPFERAVAGSDAAAQPGTGLGLTITKLLVAVMGGELVLRSKDGEGTEVTVRMMLSATGASSETSGNGLTVTGYTGERRTVLVVDDDPVLRKLMQDVLSPLDFAVIAVADGNACLSALSIRSVDIVILDVTMPGMSGWETARRIRERHGRSIPIVVLSAAAGADRGDSENDGLVDAYIAKPFSFDELYERITALVPLAWTYETEVVAELGSPHFNNDELPGTERLKQLLTLARMGFFLSMEADLMDLERSAPHTARFCIYLRGLTTEPRRTMLIAAIEEVMSDG